MATAFTHAAVGLTLGQLLPREVPARPLSLFLGAVAILPDLDVLAFRLGIPYAHPLGHRGFTHSLLFALLVGALTRGVLACRQLWRRSSRRLVALLSTVSVASHGVLDAATDAGRGIGFFIPFSNGRYFFPFRPLETSPVSPGAFLSDPGRAIEILGNELLWVGLPLLVLSVGLHVVRRRRRPRAAQGSSQ